MAEFSDLTSSEIHIGEKTVELHLDNIDTKVGARSSRVATVWAFAGHRGRN